MSGLLSFLEPEEFVGAHWHRLTGRWSSLPRFRAAAVAFEEVATALPLVFRGLGGPHALRLGATVRDRLAPSARRRARAHARRGETGDGAARGRRRLSARLARRLPRPRRQPQALVLARRLLRPDAPGLQSYDDPLQRDLDFLRRARAASEAAKAQGAGAEAAVGGDVAKSFAGRARSDGCRRRSAKSNAPSRSCSANGDGGDFWPEIETGASPHSRAARGYRPFLPSSPGARRGRARRGPSRPRARRTRAARPRKATARRARPGALRASRPSARIIWRSTGSRRCSRSSSSMNLAAPSRRRR